MAAAVKTTFFFVHLILSISYPAALAAELLGILPWTVLSFPAFMGIYVATGVLAVGVLDYVRKPSQPVTPPVRIVPQAGNGSAPVAPHDVSTWGGQTMSA